MRRSRRGWLRHRLSSAFRIGALSAAGLLLAATVVETAGSADAAASAGLTASYILSTPAFPNAVAVNAVTDTVYLASTNTLTVVNGASHAVVTIPLSGVPASITVDSATDVVYVLMSGSTPEVAVIDGASNSVSTTIGLPGTGPVAIAADSVTNQVYVANDRNGAWGLLVIDGSSSKLVGSISTGAGDPAGIAVDESTDVVWVATFAGTVMAMNPATDSVVYNISVTGAPVSVAVNPVTDTVYAGGTGSTGPLTVIDGKTGTVAATVPFAASGSVVVDPSADVVYVTNGAVTSGTTTVGGTVVVDGATNTVADVLPGVGGPAAAADPATGSVFEIASSPLGGLWDLTPSASNAISPTIFGPSSAQTVSVGEAGVFEFTGHGLPAPTVTETGPLPAGFTFRKQGSSDFAVVGVPLPGSEGVYPITISASNGVAPDYSISFTLTVTQQAIAVGVEGTDGQLWAQAPQLGNGWEPLGGKIIAPPAVAALANPKGSPPAQPMFIATGSDGSLWMRSLTAGWQPVGPVGMTCVGAPAAAFTGASAPFTLTVACEGTDHALWVNSTAAYSSQGLPQFTSGWTSLGGVLSAGPAAAPLGGTMTFFVRGTSGEIYTRTLTAGYTAMPWFCVGSPAAVLTTQGPTNFACIGTDHELWNDYWTTANGWGTASSWGGSLMAGPAVFTASNGNQSYLAEGTDHAVWEFTPEGWFSLGGGVVGGVGAAALS